MIVDLQILALVDALSTLEMEGCTTPPDSYEITSARRRREQVFIFKTSHFGGANIRKI